MRKYLFLIIFIFIITLCGCSNNSNTTITTNNTFKIEDEIPSNYKTRNDDYSYGTITEYEYLSNINGETKHYNIITPYNYDSNKEYKLLIIFPSLGESHNRYMDKTNLDLIIGNLIYEKKIEEIIVLIPNIFMGVGEIFSADAMFLSDDSPKDVYENVLPLVKNQFKITDIYIHGFSLGGREAINYLLQYGKDVKSSILVEPFYFNDEAKINYTEFGYLVIAYGIKDGVVSDAPLNLISKLKSYGIEFEEYGVDFEHDFECSSQMLYRFLLTNLEVK